MWADIQNDGGKDSGAQHIKNALYSIAPLRATSIGFFEM
jgi:hypothetical protein